MGNSPDDSKPAKIEPTKVRGARTGNNPDANNILDNLFENVGLKGSEGGTA